MRSEFYIHHAKFQDLTDKALDWYIKSLKFKRKSDEWTICRLKERIYTRQAIKHLIASTKYLYGRI